MSHQMTTPHKIAHPGGKNGWYQVECTAEGCDYVTQGFNAERAVAKFRDHQAGIAQRQRTYDPNQADIVEEAERMMSRCFTPLQRKAMALIRAEAWEAGMTFGHNDPRRLIDKYAENPHLEKP